MSKPRVLYVSFYTPSYERYAKRLEASLKKHGLAYDIVPIETRGDFIANVRYKPRFIWECMEAHPEAKYICWVDADAVIAARPRLLSQLHSDLAVRYRDGVELMSGTMLWRNTRRVREYVDAWAKECEKNQQMSLQCPEQQILQQMLPSSALSLYLLPTEYCCVPDLPDRNDAARDVKGVIVHGQASRTERYRGASGNPPARTIEPAKKAEDLRIAILLPTRARPAAVDRLLESIRHTAADLSRVDVYLRLDGDDKEMLAAAKEIGRRGFDGLRVEFRVGPRIPLGAYWNNLWQSAVAHIYMLCADDMTFASAGWDARVREEFWGEPNRALLVFGKDGVQDGKLATHFFLSAEACEHLGYFVKPEFEAIYLDTWVDEVYRKAGLFLYIPEIEIPHNHWTLPGNSPDASVRRDRGGRKARDKKRWDEGEDERARDAARLLALCKEAAA